MRNWGYPKDEYRDNGHWSPQLYIRESRRMVGSYVMTQANCEGREVVDDGIGWAAYTMDSHNCQRIVVNGMVKNEGNVEVGGFGPYPVSYRSIIPRETECKNLLVPVCLSATHIAYGSIRMEPVFMVLAQSAAVAVHIAIENKQTVQQVDVKKIQTILKANPLLDGTVPEVLVDNDDTTISIQGNWQRRTNEPALGYTGNYGPSMLVSGEASAKAQVKFIPPINTGGKYAVYSYLPRIPKASGKTHYLVFDGKKTQNVFVNSSAVLIEGQTSGEWVLLGTFSLPKGNRSFVAVTNEGEHSAIVADAVLFVPLKK